MLSSMPCMLPTAGARISIPVESTNSRASSGVVRPLDKSGARAWISEPVPISPISPSTRTAGLMLLSVSTASRVWRAFCSKGNAERSKTTASKPAFTSCTALARVCVWSALRKDGKIEFLTQASHQSRELIGPEKLALSLGGANQHRDFQVTRGCEDRLQQNQIGNIEMADRCSR